MDLAKVLIEAGSARAFLLEQDSGVDWRALASLKSEVDRLVGCDLNVATSLADRIGELSLLVGDSLSRAFAEASRARVLDNKGHHSEANRLYERAARSLKEAGLKKEAAILQKQQLHALIHLGKYKEALETASVARRVLAHAEPAELAQLEANVGNIYYRLDRYGKALWHYDRARQILAKCGDETMLAMVDFSRSNVFADLDRPDEALKLLASAAAQFDRAGRALQAGQTRFHIAYLQFLRGSYNNALTSYYEARDRLAELGSGEMVAYCDLEMAEILLALNAFDAAADSAANSRAVFQELEMPFESAKSASILGLAAIAVNRLEEAHTYLSEGREVFARGRNAIFTALSDLYLSELAHRTGNYTEMANRAGSSLRVFSRHGLTARVAHSRLLSARAAYEMGDWTRAAATAKKALWSVDPLFAPGIAYQCHHLIGRIERGRSRNRNALESFRRSIGVIERMRESIKTDEFKARFLYDKTEVYEDAIASCLDSSGESSIEEVFRLVESSKSRGLADILACYETDAVSNDRHRRSARSGAVKTGVRLSKLVQDLNWFNSQARLEEEKGAQKNPAVLGRYREALARCERQITDLFRRMEAEGHAFGDVQQMKPATELELRMALREDEIAVEYFTTGDDISCFVASRKAIRVIRAIASKRQVAPLLSALRFQLEKSSFQPGCHGAPLAQMKRVTDEHLRRLYSAVFAPIEEVVTGHKLIIIPHGALHYVPFHALYDGERYLIDRFEVSYSPSAAALRLCREMSKQLRQLRGGKTGWANDVVAIGVADADAPNIDEEISMLNRLFPASRVFVGDEATRENLFRHAPDARFLHISCHGSFRRDNPMFSYLKLADSHLNFYGLLDLRLKSEMVTLSACQTGINAILPGDELQGLVRGFLYAGAPTLVMSMWRVSDRSTAELMRELYSRLREGEPKRSALRSAQLAVRESYGHPYYWAPFILMGNPH